MPVILSNVEYEDLFNEDFPGPLGGCAVVDDDLEEVLRICESECAAEEEFPGAINTDEADRRAVDLIEFVRGKITEMPDSMLDMSIKLPDMMLAIIWATRDYMGVGPWFPMGAMSTVRSQFCEMTIREKSRRTN